jgi:hypothetical protein
MRFSNHQHYQIIRCHCIANGNEHGTTGSSLTYLCVSFRNSQPAEHHARATCLRHQQQGILCLRLPCGVLRAHGHNGRDLRADGTVATKEGAIRGRAPRIRPVPAPRRTLCCLENTPPPPSQPSSIIHLVASAVQNQRRF